MGIPDSAFSGNALNNVQHEMMECASYYNITAELASRSNVAGIMT
jgi:hypothetical protein